MADMPIVWVGDNVNKGLAVISFTGSGLAIDHSHRTTNQYIVPVQVTGQKSFRLLAVWDHNDRKEGLNRRPGPLLRALDDSSDFCQHDDLIVAGDFNNNPQWDKPDGPNNMALIARELMKRGLVSLYHKTMGLEFGAEERGTYWQYRNRAMPYHIDYIFVPTPWFESMVSFEIGNFEDWCAFSDHAPLVAEFSH
jgi:exodeoxyribonuclease-3